VYVAVREQTDEVHGLAARADLRDETLPLRAFEDFTTVDGHLNALRALVEDPAGAEGIVPDLRVAHVVVTRKPDRQTMGPQARRHRLRREPVQSRSAGEPDGVAFVVGATADAIHDDDEYRAGNPGKTVVPLQSPISHGAVLAQCWPEA
jgi:hypothetical protein